MDKPILRWPLEINHAEAAGQKVVVISDKREIAPEPIVLNAALLPIIARFNGYKTIDDIVKEGAPYGVTEGLVRQLVAELDKGLFLETERTKLRWEQLKEDFAKSKLRDAALAGLVYPADQAKLRSMIENYVNSPDVSLYSGSDDVDISGLICPHIDYRRGWQTYVSSYSVLRRMKKPDVVFLMGTAHQAGEGVFHLTDKDFATPLGTVSVATDVVSNISKRFGDNRLFANEILHKNEHSLELQLPFLVHCYGNDSTPEIVPVLVGSFHNYLLQGEKPEHSGEVGDFIEILAEEARNLIRSGKNVLFYGGVDLAHVGQHFGDNVRVSESKNGLEELSKRDGELMDCIIESDQDALFEHIAQDMDARRICGFPTIYTMLSAMKRSGMKANGQCLEYRQAVDHKEDCIVTFASACW